MEKEEGNVGGDRPLLVGGTVNGGEEGEEEGTVKGVEEKVQEEGGVEPSSAPRPSSTKARQSVFHAMTVSQKIKLEEAKMLKDKRKTEFGKKTTKRGSSCESEFFNHLSERQTTANRMKAGSPSRAKDQLINRNKPGGTTQHRHMFMFFSGNKRPERFPQGMRKKSKNAKQTQDRDTDRSAAVAGRPISPFRMSRLKGKQDKGFFVNKAGANDFQAHRELLESWEVNKRSAFPMTVEEFTAKVLRAEKQGNKLFHGPPSGSPSTPGRLKRVDADGEDCVRVWKTRVQKSEHELELLRDDLRAASYQISELAKLNVMLSKASRAPPGHVDFERNSEDEGDLEEGAVASARIKIATDTQGVPPSHQLHEDNDSTRLEDKNQDAGPAVIPTHRGSVQFMQSHQDSIGETPVEPEQVKREESKSPKPKRAI